LYHKKRNRSWKTLAAAGSIAAMLSTSAIAEELTILGGPVGGGWYLVAGGLADIVQSQYPEITVKVIPGGGVVNPPRVGTRDADIGMSLSVPTELALKGIEPYDQKYDSVRGIAFGFNVTYYQVVANEDVPVNTFEEIFSKKFPAKVTTPGLQTMGGWTVKKLFEAAGSSIDELKANGGVHYQANHTKQADLLRDGQADILMTLLQLPAPNILEVSTVRKIKFLPLSKETIDKVVAEYGYGRGVIPKDLYKSIDMKEDLPTLTMASGLIVNKDVPEELVYKFTKALFENVEKVQQIHPSMRTFVPEDIVTAVNRGNVQLHPGAERYFKEKGYNYN